MEHISTHHKKLYHKIKHGVSNIPILSKLIYGAVFVSFILLVTVLVLNQKGIYIAGMISNFGKAKVAMLFDKPKIQTLPEIKVFTAADVIEQINKKRTDDNKALLTPDDLLTKAAQSKLDDMVSQNYYDYKSPSGKEWYTNITEAGYNYEYANAALSNGYTFVSQVIDAWFIDDKIKEGFLDAKMKDIGVSVWKGQFMGTDSVVVVAYYGNKKTIYTKPTTNTNTGTNTPQITNNDPVITCNFTHLGGKLITKSQCNVSFECQINSQWYIYTSRDKCTQDQKAYYSGNTYHYSPPAYVPIPTRYIPTYAPAQIYPSTAPTPDNSAYCSQVNNEWIAFNEDFQANRLNNYSSSADGVRALEGYRQAYQNQYSSHGCSGTLRLF